MAITTIPRNHTRRIAQLAEQLTQCRVFTLENYFHGQPVEPHHAWAALGRGAKLTDNGNGTYTIRVHSNHWYELSEPHCNHDAPAVRNGACECGETVRKPPTGCATHPLVANPFCQTCTDHGNPHPFDRAEMRGCGQCGAEPGEACHITCTSRPDGAPSR